MFLPVCTSSICFTSRTKLCSFQSSSTVMYDSISRDVHIYMIKLTVSLCCADSETFSLNLSYFAVSLCIIIFTCWHCINRLQNCNQVPKAFTLHHANRPHILSNKIKSSLHDIMFPFWWEEIQLDLCQTAAPSCGRIHLELRLSDTY